MKSLLNQPEAALEACDRAERLNPFDPLGYWNSIGRALAHVVAQRFDHAIEWADRALHEQPRLMTACRVKAVAYAYLGHLAEAHAEVELLLAGDPNMTLTSVTALFRSAAPEFVEFYIAGLRRAGLPEEWPASLCRGDAL